jgi:hypothetical protein
MAIEVVSLVASTLSVQQSELQGTTAQVASPPFEYGFDFAVFSFCAAFLQQFKYYS